MSRGDSSTLAEFGAFPEGPRGGELILLMRTRRGPRVAAGEVSRAHAPVLAPLFFGHFEGFQPQSLSLRVAGQAVEGDSGVLHRRVTTDDAVTRHSEYMCTCPSS